MGQTTKTVISDILPVAMILVLLFFFLETALGKKLLSDLWNLITKGINPVSSSKDTNNQSNTVVQNSNSNGNGGGSGTETLLPTDSSQSLNVKNSGGTSTTGSGNGGGSGGSTSTGNGGSGQTQTNTQPEPVTAPTTTASQRPTTPQVLSPVDMVKKLFSNTFSYPTPLSTVYYNKMPEQNNTKQPTQTATAPTPTPNPTQTIDQINAGEKISNPLPQQPDLLSQVQTNLAGVGSSLVSGITALGNDLSGIKLPFALPPFPNFGLTNPLEVPIA